MSLISAGSISLDSTFTKIIYNIEIIKLKKMWNRFKSVGEIKVYFTLQISTGGGDQESDGFHLQVGVLG